MSFPILFLIVLATLALVFVASELLVRVWMKTRAPYYVWTPYGNMRLHLDTEALPWLPATVHFDVNRDGERGAEPPLEWDDNYRVLVTGGSAAECYYLDQQSTWPEYLGAELNRPESLEQLEVQGVHVGNVARSLVSCEHVSLMLERSLPRYRRLDVIVLMVGASDMFQWLEFGTPEELPDRPLPLDYLFGWQPEGPFTWSPGGLALRRLATLVWHHIRRPVQVREKTGKRMIELRRRRAEAETIVTEVPDSAPMTEHFERGFRRLLDTCKTKARRVVVARQPWAGMKYTPEEERARLWNFGQGRPYERALSTYYHYDVAWSLMEKIDQAAARIAEEYGVEQVDINHFVSSDFENYYDEMHHTPAGNRRVAKAVADQILEGESRPILDASPEFARSSS